MTAFDRRGRFLSRVRRLYDELAATEGLRRAFFRREHRALLGAAMVHSGTRTRHEIRRIARHSNTRHYLHLTELDEGLVDDLVIDGEENLAAATADGTRGAILAALHIGAFRRLAPFFVLRGFRVALLATRHSDELVGEVPEVFASGDADAARRYALVDSTSPAAMWRLSSALREGSLVVFYPDGNTGIDGKTPDESCQLVELCGQRVRVHAGIGWLASATDRPVIPVVARESASGRPVVELGAPIRRVPSEPRSAFRARVIETLYAQLDEEIARAPARWEQWAFVWQWAARAGSSVSPPAVGAVDLDSLRARRLRLTNPHVWSILLEDDALHTLDVRSWTSFGTSPALADLVRFAEEGQLVGVWLERHPPNPSVSALFATMRALGVVDVV